MIEAEVVVEIVAADEVVVEDVDDEVVIVGLASIVDPEVEDMGEELADDELAMVAAGIIFKNYRDL